MLEAEKGKAVIKLKPAIKNGLTQTEPYYEGPFLSYKDELWQLLSCLLSMHSRVLAKKYHSVTDWNYILLTLLFVEPDLNWYRPIFFDAKPECFDPLSEELQHSKIFFNIAGGDQASRIQQSLIQAISLVAKRNWQAFISQRLCADALDIAGVSDSPEMKALNMYLRFLGAVMESASEYHKKEGCSIQSVIEPLLQVAEQGYLPAETLICQMLDSDTGVFLPDQWKGKGSPLALKQRLAVISILRPKRQGGHSTTPPESNHGCILDEISERQKILQGEVSDNLRVKELVELVEGHYKAQTPLAQECREALDDLQDTLVYGEDLVKVTCRLFKLLDPQLVIALQDFSLSTTEACTLPAKYYDGAFLQCGTEGYEPLLECLLNMHSTFLKAEYDPHVFWQFVQLALLFKTPDPESLQLIFFPRKTEVRKPLALPRPYFLLQQEGVTACGRFGQALYKLLLIVYQGVAQNFTNWGKLEAVRMLETVEEYQKPRVEIFTKFIRSLMQSAASRYRSPKSPPQSILQELKGVAVAGYAPAADLIADLIESKEHIFSEDQLENMGNVTRWRKPILKVLGYRKPETAPPRCPVSKDSPEPESFEANELCHVSTDQLLHRWKPEGKGAGLPENRKYADELQKREQELIKICQDILTKDNAGQLNRKTVEIRVRKLLKLNIPGLNAAEKQQLTWLGYGCHHYEDHLAVMNHYLSDHLCQDTLVTGANYLMTVVKNTDWLSRFMCSLDDVPSLEPGILLALGCIKSMDENQQIGCLKKLFPDEKLYRNGANLSSTFGTHSACEPVFLYVEACGSALDASYLLLALGARVDRPPHAHQ